ncbi:hypothetical protein PED39_05240 [Methanomassiliicoccales archaeon LGM-RCC1]|nr:hypothetical protein PED39_05240 [Methanomassiliicoccales archaeon LGM-RCC1]
MSMPSPKEVIYPEGDDCSKCIHCSRIELGKVICNEYGTIDPELTCRWPKWPVTIDECPSYVKRPEFREVEE